MAIGMQLGAGAVIGGDFRVLEPLAAGGMGAIYIAEQLSTGKRRAPKVMHAGLVQDPKLRERFEREARAGARTTATVPMGTPAWMSPEQTDPRAAITPATDVWAIGLIAFWLLSGRPYWHSALDPTASIHAIMREILFEPIEPASRRAQRK